ncbi:hypothetical protein SAMN06269250_2327 [Spirosoma fluviale]|uniref:Uncharacterized protein n=1 Tax=Spirosoma fluviale TaxID=1597977 RepID=A0A286FIE6_9BACT|nr:hypothetical protein SAMN06269250_2327 [Spirosoma fluviale]
MSFAYDISLILGQISINQQFKDTRLAFSLTETRFFRVKSVCKLYYFLYK